MKSDELLMNNKFSCGQFPNISNSLKKEYLKMFNKKCSTCKWQKILDFNSKLHLIENCWLQLTSSTNTQKKENDFFGKTNSGCKMVDVNLL